jgi:RNA polymerase sigma-54 factor
VAEEMLNNPFLLHPEGENKQDYQEPAYDRDPDPVLQEQEYSNFWSEAAQKDPIQGSRQDWFENLAPIRIGLRHHLMVQLHLSTQDPDYRALGEALIDGMDDDGYIRLNLQKFADDVNQPITKVLLVLKLLQTFEPVGVCAQTLIDCFEIQLKDQGILTPTMERVLPHMELALSRGWEGVAKECGLSKDEVEASIKILRTLNPKPGLSFDPEPVETLIPDLFVRLNGQGDIWVELNEEAQPRVLANQGYYQELNKRMRTREEKIYVTQNYQQATWLEKALKQRTETMLKVSHAIVESQKAYLLGLQKSLNPMTLKDLALELGLHESTISRAITNKYMVTPMGVRELKDMFTHAVRADDGLSAHHVQQRIRALIDQELAIKPLSDDQIVVLLQKEGVDVARRTVTKYREGMNIPSSYERKKQARLMTF